MVLITVKEKHIYYPSFKKFELLLLVVPPALVFGESLCDDFMVPWIAFRVYVVLFYNCILQAVVSFGMAMKCYSRDFKMIGSWHRFLQGGKMTLDWFRVCLMAGMAPELPDFVGWGVCFIRWELVNVRSARNRLFSVKIQVVSPAQGVSVSLWRYHSVILS